MANHYSNPRCGGFSCKEPDGEIRALPVVEARGGGVWNLCESCYQRELRWLSLANEPLTPWSTASVVRRKTKVRGVLRPMPPSTK